MNREYKNFFKKALILIVLFFVVLVDFSSALEPVGEVEKLDQPSILLEELPGLTNADMYAKFTASGTDGFIYYLNWIVRISIALGTVVAVSTLIFGGFLYITTDNFLKKGQGKEMIRNALLGLVLLLMSYVLLGQINSNILEIKFKPAKIEVKGNGNIVVQYGPEPISSKDFDKVKGDYEKIGECASRETDKVNNADPNKKLKIYEVTDEMMAECIKKATIITNKNHSTKAAVCVVEIKRVDKDGFFGWFTGGYESGQEVCLYKHEDAE